MQSVQNAAARLVTGSRRCVHITPVLRILHWLPVRQRVDFKVATLVHRSLSGNSASYLADACRLVADARERRLYNIGPIRSTESRTCVVIRIHSTSQTSGDRAFAAAGLGLWKVYRHISRDADLPYSRFRRSLNTFFVWMPRRSANYFNCAV